MIPELASTYGLSPDDVWNMSQSQYDQFIRHHDEMVKAAKNA